MTAAVHTETKDAAMRAALYLRVSTGRQAEADLSIPDQRRQVLAFCAARGWDVAIEFVEPGASGMDDRRPEFQRMLDMAVTEAPPFNVIAVHSFSRFARDRFRQAQRHSDAQERLDSLWVRPREATHKWVCEGDT